MFTEKFRVVTDSSANLSSLTAAHLTSVPLKIVTQNKEYVDDAQLDVDGMVRDLQAYTGRTTTSCPNVHDWMEAFRGAQHVFAVTITSHLSGAYASAMQAKRDYESEFPGAKVHVIDSLSTGPEMALLIEKLLADFEADMSYAEIVTRITAYQVKTHLLFALQSVQNLARNGRVHPAVAKLVGILNIRIIGRASSEGELETLHKTRGDRQSLQKLWAEIQAHGYRGGAIRIDHCGNESGASSLAQFIRQMFPSASIKIGRCTGLCSFYAEAGGILVGFETP